MDLVIQSEDLSTEAFDAFRVALLAQRPCRHVCAARLPDVGDNAENRRVAAALARFWRCDATFVPRTLRATEMRVLVMDMDSTVITIECIDELARLAGQGERVAAITEAAMRGEIADFAESLRRRVALLAGARDSLLARVLAERLRYQAGARELLGQARALGWSTLLVSGGFSFFSGAVAEELGFDAAVANELVIRDGRLTGEVQGPEEYGGRILDGAGKAAMLQHACAQARCPATQALAVGDGANDLPMMAAAGVSVAFRAKPRVRERARFALEHAALDGVLELFSDRW